MCNYLIEHAFQHVRGDLPGGEAEAYRVHLQACTDCDLRVRQAEQVRRLSRQAAADVPTVDWRRVQSGVRDAVVARRRPLLPTLLLPLATAAVAALVLVVIPNDEPVAPAPTSARVERTFVESSRALTLSDGSTLTVPNGAEVQLLANGAERVAVRLVSGSVTADVARNPARTEFLVEAGTTEVRVLGTRFTVTLEQDRTAVVAVEHGRVQVKDGSGLVAEVAAGEERRFAAAVEAALMDETTTAEAPKAVEPQSVEAAVAPERAPTPEVETAAAARREPEEVASAEPRARQRAEQARRAPRPAPAPHRSTSIGEPQPKATTAPEAVEAVALASLQPRVETPPVETEILAVETGETVVEVTSVTSEPLFNTGRSGVLAIVQGARDGRCGEVRPLIERFLATNHGHRNYADVLYIQGYCQMVRGQRERGLRTWKRYESLDPGGPWLQSVGDWTNPSPPDPALVR
jgi:ferric-dicitrate binding protein FerR (iron transport regulator)